MTPWRSSAGTTQRQTSAGMLSLQQALSALILAVSISPCLYMWEGNASEALATLQVHNKWNDALAGCTRIESGDGQRERCFYAEERSDTSGRCTW